MDEQRLDRDQHDQSLRFIRGAGRRDRPVQRHSSISQTFVAPGATSQLAFWYRVVCTDTVTYDWAAATLRDTTTGTTATVLAKTCSNSGTWARVTASITAGRSYTLTLIDHDDNFAADPTYTLYDEVTVQ